MDVEWDPTKAGANLKKHGVRFTDVEAVFFDPLALSMEDPDAAEQRFVVVGRDEREKVLIVVYADSGHDSIRIITARHATPAERKRYEKGI